MLMLALLCATGFAVHEGRPGEAKAGAVVVENSTIMEQETAKANAEEKTTLARGSSPRYMYKTPWSTKPNHTVWHPGNEHEMWGGVPRDR